MFLINNLHQLRSTLSLYPGTEQRLAELADTLNSRLVGLSKEQVHELLKVLSLLSPALGSPPACISSPGTSSPTLGEQRWNPSFNCTWLSPSGANLLLS